MLRLVALACDLLIILCLAAITYVFVTGGGVFLVDGIRVSLRGAGRAAFIAGVLLAIRYAVTRAVPLSSWIDARVLLIPGIVLSIVLRTVNALLHPGFVTGDDVEIHVLTFCRLMGHRYGVWNLRSPFYQMAFIYPFQYVAYRAGADVGALVATGRLTVIALSTATLWCVYGMTRRLTSSVPAAALATLLLATSRLYVWFGSTELPRPVAALFVTAAAWMLIDRGVTRALVAGALLGLGGSLRFAELMFFAPAIVQLGAERRIRDAVALGIGSAAAAAICLGIADWLYWGAPFASLRNIFVYTVVNQHSSRGFQGPWFYASHLAGWSNVVLLALALVGTRAQWRIGLWAWMPVLILSCLPHKEERYLVAVLPFMCIAAAVGVRDLAARASTRAPLPMVSAALALAISFELSGWRLTRSDEAVVVARQIAAAHRGGIAAPQIWRFGGPLYWHDVPRFADVPDEGVTDAWSPPAGIDTVVLPEELAGGTAADRLARLGFMRSTALSTERYAAFIATP
jgi:hypothetical protein